MYTTHVYPDAHREALTEHVYTENLDSVRRRAGGPSDYHIDLSDTVSNVTQIALGEFVMGADPRLPFEQARRHFMISQPLHMTQTSSFTVREVSSYYSYNTTTQMETLASVTTHTAVPFVLPRTMNSFTTVSVSSGALLFETSEAHGLTNVYHAWPSGLYPSIVSSLVINQDPVVSPSVARVVTNNTFSISQALLTTISTGSFVGAHVNTTYKSATLTSWLMTPRLLISEYANVIQTLLDVNTDAGSLSNRYRCEYDASTGLVRLGIRDNHVTWPRPSVRVERRALVGVNQGDVLWRLGANSGSYVMPFLRSTRRVDNSVGKYAAFQYENTECRTMDLVPRDTRLIEMPLGSATDLGLLMSHRCGPLVLDPSLGSSTRQLSFVDTGSTTRITVPSGQYTPNLLADYLTDQLNTLSYVTGMTVSFNTVTGNFRFRSTLNVPFGIRWTQSGSQLASIMGFSTVTDLVGSSTYDSNNAARGVCAVSDIPYETVPRYALTWKTDTNRKILMALNKEPSEGSQYLGISSVSGYYAMFSNFSTTSGTILAHGLVPEDVIRVQAPSGTVSYSVVVMQTATAVNPHIASMSSLSVVTIGSGLTIDTDDLATFAVPWSRHPMRNAFMIHPHQVPFTVRLPDTDFGGSQIVNSVSTALRAPGEGSMFGPAASILGLGSLDHSWTLSGAYEAPAQYNVAPPEYMLMELVSLTNGAEKSHMHATTRADDDAKQQILSKILVTDEYAQVSSLRTQIHLREPRDIRQLHVRLLNPDHSLVDLHGRDHSYSIHMQSIDGQTHKSHLFG